MFTPLRVAGDNGTIKVSNQTIQLFDTWALSGRGDAMADGHWPRVQNFFNDLELSSGLSCLDIGCGNGYLVRKIAEAIGTTGKAIGIDASKEMVELATQRSSDVSNTEYRVAKAERLPFEDDAFDRIVSVEMLYYASSPEEALKEWYRVTKEEGSLWVMVDYYEENPYSACWGDLLEVPVHYFSTQEYKILFEAAGFKQIQARRLFDPRPVEHANFKAGWGYNTVKDVEDFRQNVGSLLISAKKV